jgi:hypothetical protein
VGALVVGVGLLHMPFARSLLTRAGGCPFGSQLTHAQAEQARHLATAPIRSSAAGAPARPAMVFTLDETTPTQVKAWARDHQLSCNQPRPGTLRCENVPAEALGLAPAHGTDAEVWLMFDAEDRLVNASTWRSHLAADAASKTASEITSTLTSRLGAPSWSVGTFDAQHLSGSGTESLGDRAYRFGDYGADISTLRLPGSGITVREHYISARD